MATTINEYLDAIQVAQRGATAWTVDRWRRRVKGLHKELDTERDPTRRLELAQSLLRAQQRLEAAVLRAEVMDAMPGLQAAFEAVAARYGSQHGITWKAWRQMGVPRDVLRRAGVPERRQRAPGSG